MRAAWGQWARPQMVNHSLCEKGEVSPEVTDSEELLYRALESASGLERELHALEGRCGAVCGPGGSLLVSVLQEHEPGQAPWSGGHPQKSRSGCSQDGPRGLGVGCCLHFLGPPSQSTVDRVAQTTDTILSQAGA